MNYLEKYAKANNKTLLLSKSSSFLIAILVFLQIFEVFEIYLHSPNLYNHYFYTNLFGLFFILWISGLFALRFVFLWIEQAKYIWFSQFFWLLGWLSIIGYKLVTAKFLFGSFWATSFEGCIDCFYFETFLFASNTLVIILLSYLIISPIKQLSTFIYSLFLKE